MASANKTPTKALILWAWPRSRSTIFERFMLARPDSDIEVVHEPLSAPYYWSDQRVSLLYSQERLDSQWREYSQCTYAQTWSEMMTLRSGKKAIFIKDMASHIMQVAHCGPKAPRMPDYEVDGNPTFIPSQDLMSPGVKHVFLIRSPEKCAPSFARLARKPDIGPGHFDPEQLGVRHSATLYRFLESNLAEAPTIIESDDVVERTEAVVCKLCDLLCIDFCKEMLDWPKDPKVDALFKKWEGWHDDVASTAGVDEGKAYGHDWPVDDQIETAIADNMEDYLDLKARAYSFVA